MRLPATFCNWCIGGQCRTCAAIDRRYHKRIERRMAKQSAQAEAEG